MVMTTSALNLRASSNSSSKRLATIPQGTVLRPTVKASNGWQKVTYKGITGWVSGKHVKGVNASTSPKAKIATVLNQRYKGSKYSVFADGIDWKRPVGILFWFDGDCPASYCSTPVAMNPRGSMATSMAKTAAKKNMVLVSPMTPAKPTRAEGYTWWVKGPQNAAWFRGFEQAMVKKVGAKKSNIAYAGRSGGAEFITYELNATKQSKAGTATNIIIAGGGAPERYHDAPSEFKSKSLIWVVGKNDKAGQTIPATWSAHSAAKKGQRFYKAEGFKNARIVELPGVRHAGYNNVAIVGKYLPKAR